MITILDHPLVHHDLRILRDKNTGTELFRNAAFRIGLHLAVESTKYLTCDKVSIETPMETTLAGKIKQKVIIVPVLRAGLAMVDSFKTIYPDCCLGYLGLRRDENTFEAEEYYYSLPQICEEVKVIVLEMMLATGGSSAYALNKLQLEGVSDMTIISVIAAPEGIEKIRAEFPNVRIISASLDRELNSRKYILPGLGDAGDRYSGF